LSGWCERRKDRNVGVNVVIGAGGGCGWRCRGSATGTSDTGFSGGGGQTCLSPQSSDRSSGLEGEGERRTVICEPYTGEGALGERTNKVESGGVVVESEDGVGRRYGGRMGGENRAWSEEDMGGWS